MPRAATAGIAFIVLSSVIFAPLTQTVTKFLAEAFPIIQIMFFRSLGQTVWMFVFFWPSHRIEMFRSKRPVLQILRSGLLFVSAMLWVAAVAEVPLTTASAINFTAPIMVVILSIPLLGERVGIHRWAAVAVGFIGAMIVIQPGAGEVPVEVFYLAGAAFLFALYQIMTRKLTAIDSDATSSVYTVIVALVVSAALVPWHFEMPTTDTALVWTAFAASGLLGGVRHFLVIKAYANAPASVISPFFYGELVGVATLGYLVFGDVPAQTTWLGAVVIVASGLYIAQRERLSAKQDS